MYYIGLDVHKKTISYCVKDVSGRIQQEGKVGRPDASWTVG
jgi:transposase